MHGTLGREKRLPFTRRALVLLLLTAAAAAAVFLRPAGLGARQQPAASSPSPDAVLLDGFRHVEVASVSDALEQLTGKKCI